MRIVLDNNAIMPTRAHSTDAGLDLYSPEDHIIKAHSDVVIDTGVHIELPENTAGLLKSKSGLNVIYSITSDGVIDVGYTGSIKVKLYNHSNQNYSVSKGDKITQLLIVPIVAPELEVVKNLKPTDRGNAGFGSTGK